MAKGNDAGSRAEKDPPWVHTTHDGRKFIRSNEFMKLPQFKEQIEKFKKLTRPGSKPLKG